MISALGNDALARDYEIMGCLPPAHILSNRAATKHYFNALAAPTKLYLDQTPRDLDLPRIAPNPFTFLYRFEDILNKGLSASDMEQVLNTITRWIVAREELFKATTS